MVYITKPRTNHSNRMKIITHGEIPLPAKKNQQKQLSVDQYRPTLTL